MIWHDHMKVVCIDDSGSRSDGHGPEIFVGQVYTISGAFDSALRRGSILLKLAECPGPFGWYSWRFRPAVDRPTSIAIFEKLLSPSPSREVETV